MPQVPTNFSDSTSPFEEDPLRAEIAFLGELLGQTIVSLAGSDALDLVEQLRRIAWERRRDDDEEGTDSDLTRFIAGLDVDQLRIVIRAFTTFLDLVNLAEDRHRVRVLRERERVAHPNGRSESIRQATIQLQQSGMSADAAQELVESLRLELVFTSHPTEAKRRSVRRKLRRMRELLYQRDTPQLPGEQQRTDRNLRAVLAKLWQTDFIRPWRPTVMQEVERGLSIKPVLWELIPNVMRDLRASLMESFGQIPTDVESCFRFGSWIGGDRDGHPGVTPQVTEQTLVWLRNAALEYQLSACSELFESLSLSQRQLNFGAELNSGVYAACEHWPQLKIELAGIPPNEMCRRWLRVIHWRLRQTQQVTLDQPVVVGAYGSSPELRSDVSTLLDAVGQSPAADLLCDEVRAWLDRVHTFGFHLARLDIRQESSQYRAAIDEILQAAGLADDPQALDESTRQQLLVDTLNQRLQIASQDLSETTRQTIALFELLHRVERGFGEPALGGHVISMTHATSDILAVLWLFNQTVANSLVAPTQHRGWLPIIPLFETIEDLRNGPDILDAALSNSVYRQYVRQQGDKQTVMLGYSDSTKDGGYIAACWWLNRAQQRLVSVADRHDVKLTFFHGRGGSLGRGGGPAARSILSLPADTFAGSLRLTEQGEVLADRYDDPEIAYRHLEQLVWSSLLASAQPPPPNRNAWLGVMQQLCDDSLTAYRKLVDQPGFVDFFRTTTPIGEIEQLPIGSRPSRRQGGSSLKELRAIPWVFSWTQCRWLLPAWYGLGSAVEAAGDSNALRLLQTMYREWPFFRATIDNAELAIAMADLDIARQYAALTESPQQHARIEAMLVEEFHRTRRAIVAISGNDELLDGILWLKESIRVRNRYIDPLNLIQVDLLRRMRACPAADEQQIEELRHLTRLTINGVAAGMRTSG